MAYRKIKPIQNIKTINFYQTDYIGFSITIVYVDKYNYREVMKNPYLFQHYGQIIMRPENLYKREQYNWLS